MLYFILKYQNVGSLTKKEQPKAWQMPDQMMFYKDTEETHQFWMIIQDIENWNAVGGNLFF